MLILGKKDVESLLIGAEIVDVVEEAFIQHGRGMVVMPPKTYLPLPQYAGDFRAMPAQVGDAVGVKWVNSHVNNPVAKNLPTVMAVIILNDPSSGLPLAVIDGTVITKYRTGAASVVATKYLGPSHPQTLGMIGCGVQGVCHIELFSSKFTFQDIKLYDVDPARIDRMIALFPQLKLSAATLEETAGCDVVCTITPGKSPFLQRKFLSAGCHINAIGADGSGKREFYPGVFQGTRVFVDDMEQASHSGEISEALLDSSLLPEQVCGTLGEVVAGLKPGRLKDEITIFDSTGLGIQDIAVAKHLYQTALEKGQGLHYEL